MSAYYICAFITAVSAFVSLGYSLANWRRANAHARTNANYVLARSTPLAIIAVMAFPVYQRDFLVAIASIMILVQVFDGLVGARAQKRIETWGPFGTALANFIALIFVL